MNDKHYFEKIFSTQRMDKYFKRYPGNEQKAIEHYQLNIELSESFYSILSIFEIALRNSLNRELSRKYGDSWYLTIGSVSGLNSLSKNINKAKQQITSRNEIVTADKVVAELTLGFWVKLLNSEYERILWKPLRNAFPYVEKNQRQRHRISAPINKIREFRNRVFHYEPIAWNLSKLEEIRNSIYNVMSWLNIDLPYFAITIDKSKNAIEMMKRKLQNFNSATHV